MKKTIFLLFTLVFSTYAHAALTDHLVALNADHTPHRMRGIDCIYMINLDERPQKWSASEKQLQKHGITALRVPAINGWKLSGKVLNELGVKYEAESISKIKGITFDPETAKQKCQHMRPGKWYYSIKMSKGAIGCALSHISVLQDALQKGYETIWVMEDDIHVVSNPHMLSHFIDELDAVVGNGEWDILFTDPDSKTRTGEPLRCNKAEYRPNFSPKNRDRFAKRKEIHPDFTRVGARYGAYSMIIRRSGIRKLMQFFTTHNLFLPYDCDYCLPNDIKLYSLTRELVTTYPQALSDNWSPGY